jgi:hypothetical protein
MTQPGSFRDSAESFSKIAATSDSRPTFAIQVTANTTIRHSPFLQGQPLKGLFISKAFGIAKAMP